MSIKKTKVKGYKKKVLSRALKKKDFISFSTSNDITDFESFK